MTIKIGMIGLDTSHCPAFTKLINNADDKFHVPGGHVAKAFPGGSQTFSLSSGRVGQFTTELKAMGVQICDSIQDAADGMDAFLLESVDGSQHLEQFRILAEYGKPVFIDKPLACSHQDALAIAEIAAAKNIPVMTASAIRYAKGIEGILTDEETVTGCDAFGPMALLADYRDYFWYGIHSADVLYSFMGKGCRSVQTFNSENSDLLVGLWDDGRIGTIRGNRAGANNFGCTVTTNKITKSTVASGEIPYYAQLLKQIMPFYKSGKSPIDLAESLEIMAFLDAASQSRANGGKVVKI